MDTKSLDRRLSLLHYIADTITSRYPNLAAFINDLQFVEKASGVSLENVLSDLHDLEKGMELTKKESQFLMQKNEQNNVRKYLTWDVLSLCEYKPIGIGITCHYYLANERIIFIQIVYC